ncbi:saccharopine dehydrogenase NADP binding domain-containing protein [Encephalitozoon hellem]|nr:saccharopine dehydrogenase NADP binding domain-containing protein [Encephalitozoon hellem]
MEREYDFIIYGASGYAARYIIEAFKSENVRLALAARNISKIKDKAFPVYECEIDGIDEIASMTKILINCVGPYSRYGESIVKSCIRNGTHYMDISGEVYFFEFIINKYHDEAARKGVYIINCCGFESVPSDVGVMYLRNMFEDAEIESVLKVSNVVVNETTWVSLLSSVANFKELKMLREKRYGQGKKRRSHRIVRENSYQVIFRGIDYSIVRRSQELMESVGMHGAKYSAYLDVGGRVGMIKYWIFIYLVWFFSGFSAGKWIIMNLCKFFTFGFGFVKSKPSFEEIRKASFTIEIRARGERKNEIVGRSLTITGPDPSYIMTSICLTQTAVVFLKSLNQRVRGTGVTLFRGGVITPACVLYNTDIVQRLSSKGIKFEVKEN